MLPRTSLLLLFLLLPSCAHSLDPTPDINRAATTVESRTGLLPNWLTPAPADELPSQLSSDDAARIALTHDARLRAALERIAESRADLVQSGLLPNPVLALDLGFPIDGSGGATKVGVSLTQQLAALISRRDRIASADADLRAHVLLASDLALRTAADARAAHARLLAAQDALEPAQDAVASAERSVDVARRRAVAGEDNALAVNRQRLLLLRLRADLAQRQADLQLRKRDLLARLGIPDSSVDLTASPASGTGLLPGVPDSEPAVIAAAKSDRLDVAAARATADAALARVNVQRKSRLDLSAGPAFERTDDGRKELGPALDVSIPIFDTGDARVAKARAEAQRLALDADSAERTAIAEARSAFIAAQSARALAHTYESEVVSLSTTNIDLAQRAFAAGQSDLTVLLEAQQAVVDAKLKLIELHERAAIAEIELRRAIGR
jgi:outer membrane protein TolC